MILACSGRHNLVEIFFLGGFMVKFLLVQPAAVGAGSPCVALPLLGEHRHTRPARSRAAPITFGCRCSRSRGQDWGYPCN